MTHTKRHACWLIGGFLAPFSVQAELTVLDEAGLRETTGQAGITIDLSAQVGIGEIAYQDQGYIFVEQLQLGGAGVAERALGIPQSSGLALDNLRMTIDVAGAEGADLGSDWGLAKLDGTALQSSSVNRGDHGVTPVLIEDGDLVISLDAQDHAEGVDFGLLIDNVRLGKSGLLPGEGSSGGASIASGLKFKGMLGPTDIVVDEQENRLNINTFFSLDGELTMDWYIPILLDYKSMSFGLSLHNRRGEDILVYDLANGQSRTYAYLQADVGATEDNQALEVNLTDFSGDMDWTDVHFGQSPAIGDIYWTDLQVQANLKIYGH